MISGSCLTPNGLVSGCVGRGHQRRVGEPPHRHPGFDEERDERARRLKPETGNRNRKNLKLNLYQLNYLVSDAVVSVWWVKCFYLLQLTIVLQLQLQFFLLKLLLSSQKNFGSKFRQGRCFTIGQRVLNFSLTIVGGITLWCFWY